MDNKLPARDRTITIQLWKYTSQSVDVNISIPQDFCLSILYLFYSTDNLEETSHDISWTAIRGWMDGRHILSSCSLQIHRGELEETCSNAPQGREMVHYWWPGNL